ncbi:TPA: hypothetical protein ACHSXF_001429 [Pseudomonas aeruginosa]
MRRTTPLVRQMISYRVAGLFSQASVNTMFRQYCCSMCSNVVQQLMASFRQNRTLLHAPPFSAAIWRSSSSLVISPNTISD